MFSTELKQLIHYVSEIHVNFFNSISVKFLRWVKIYFANSSLKKLMNYAFDICKTYTKNDLYIIIRLNTSSGPPPVINNASSLLDATTSAAVNETSGSAEVKQLNIKPSHTISINSWGYLNFCARKKSETLINSGIDNSSGHSILSSDVTGSSRRLPNSSEHANNNKRSLVFYPEPKENVAIHIESDNYDKLKTNSSSSSYAASSKEKKTCLIYNTKIKGYQKFYCNDIKNTIREKKLNDLNMDYCDSTNAFVLVPKQAYDELWINNTPINENEQQHLREQNLLGHSEGHDDHKRAELQLTENIDSLLFMTFPAKRIKHIKKISQEMMFCKFLTFKKDGRVFLINSFPSSFNCILKANKNWKSEPQITNHVISTLEFLHKASLRANYFNSSSNSSNSDKNKRKKNNKKKIHNIVEIDNLKLFKIVAELLIYTNTPLFLLNKDLLIDKNTYAL